MKFLDRLTALVLAAVLCLPLCAAMADFDMGVRPLSRYKVLDDDAMDPDTGTLTNGTEYANEATVLQNTTVFSMPDDKGEALGLLNAGQLVYALAKDPYTDDFLIAFLHAGGKIQRGWVRQQDLRVEGTVPDFVWKYKEKRTLSMTTNAMRAPRYDACQAPARLKAGTIVTVRFSEDDEYGNEWLYVEANINRKDTLVYVPANAFKNAEDTNPQPFAIASCETYAKLYLGRVVTFGTYQELPVSWFVVDVDNQYGTVLLVSQYAVDVVRYHSSKATTSWANSDMRRWLNNSFFWDAFDMFEQEAIVDSVVEGCSDKVFILSARELTAYMPYLGNTAQLTGTPFCHTKKTNTGCPIYVNNTTKTSSWWLRSAYTADYAELVSGAGKINGAKNYPYSTDNGVRPVIRITLDQLSLLLATI